MNFERLLYGIERFVLTDVMWDKAHCSFYAAHIVKGHLGGKIIRGVNEAYEYHYWNIVGSAWIDSAASLRLESHPFSSRVFYNTDVPNEEEQQEISRLRRLVDDFLDGHRNVGNGCG